MIINWGALVLVACATVVAAVAIVGLFSLGVAALMAGADSSVATADQDGAIATHPDSRSGLLPLAGYACMGTAGVFVLYGLYLIIPQFH